MYPTTAELLAASTVAALADLEPAQQDALRDEAILAIEGHCRQSFTAVGTTEEPTTRTLDGGGGRTLHLPQRLAELVSVTVLNGWVSTEDVALNDDHDRLSIPSERDGWNWATQAVAEMRHYREIHFPDGPGSVAVAGVWGWADDETPAAIATALRFDMEDRALANSHALAETVRSARALGLTSVSQGGLSIEMGQRAGNLGATPGEAAVSMRVGRLLADLLWEPAYGSRA